MWEIIGDNYEIVNHEFNNKAIVIPDELYYKIKKEVSKEVLSLTLSNKQTRFIRCWKRSDWEEELRKQEELK